ncbi:MAG: HAD hydrolase-like protein [Clostridiales bacterium]|nr:HAD hydrolase-like protein [Clostridiales bacterium]
MERISNYKYLFFDLDGTLTQSEFGIIDSVLYALNKLGIEEPERDNLKRFIGPPLFDSFSRYYHMDQQKADEAVRLYREIYEVKGVYNQPLYEGIKDVLERLTKDGFTLLVVTSKPTEMAEIVLKHDGIREFFKDVIGPSRAERHSEKEYLIRTAIDLLGEYSETAPLSLMIGDRHYDIEGAVRAGIDSMGVLYGYGSREELEGAGATYIVETPEEIY